VDLAWGGTNATSSWNFYINGALMDTRKYTDYPIVPTIFQVLDEANNQGNQTAGSTANHVTWGSPSIKTAKTGAYGGVSIPNRPTDVGIASHAKTDMTNPDSTWDTWDSRY
jgi:hypothetical protein